MERYIEGTVELVAPCLNGDSMLAAFSGTVNAGSASVSAAFSGRVFCEPRWGQKILEFEASLDAFDVGTLRVAQVTVRLLLSNGTSAAAPDETIHVELTGHVGASSVTAFLDLTNSPYKWEVAVSLSLDQPPVRRCRLNTSG